MRKVVNHLSFAFIVLIMILTSVHLVHGQPVSEMYDYSNFDSIEEAAEFLLENVEHEEPPLICVSFPSDSSDRRGEYDRLEALAFSNETADPFAGDFALKHVSGGSLGGGFENGRCYLYIRYNYYITPEELEKEKNLISEINKSLEIPDDSADYEIVAAIENYIQDHVSYDNASIETEDKTHFTAYKAVTKGRATCLGYSELFYAFCKLNGINARILTTPEHALNLCEIDGIYYFADCVWDQPIELLNGEKTVFPNESSGFLTGLNDQPYFKENKLPDRYTSAEFNDKYPIADNRYEPKVPLWQLFFQNIVPGILGSFFRLD